MLWNATKEKQPMTGVKRYEEELYKNLKNLAEEFEIEVERIRRGNNKVLGSTFISWMLRYRCNEADIVHATMETLAPVTEIKRPKKFVVTVHGLLPMLAPSSTIRDLTTKITWKLVPITLKKADKIIAVSEFTKNELIKVLGIEDEKIEVIYHGVDHNIYKPMDKELCRRKLGLSNDYKYMLVVAADLKQKRLDIVKKVFLEIRKIRDDVKLLYVGSGELFGDEFVNLGEMRGGDMPLVYNAADVYFHPSEYESFGLPILESMACGLPVVASNKASIPEIVGNAGVLVDLESENVIGDFVENILKAIERNLCRKSLRQSYEFSWGKTARSTVKTYEEVLIAQ